VKETVACAFCAKLFDVFPSRLKLGTQCLCCSRECAVAARNVVFSKMPLTYGSHRIVRVQCDYGISQNCKREWDVSVRYAHKIMCNNGGKMICLQCSRKSKSSGRKNPNCKYKFDDNMLDVIDTAEKAYLLGWIASDGCVHDDRIVIEIHRDDVTCLARLRDIVCRDIPIVSHKNTDLFGFSVCSSHMASSVANHLRCQGRGKKSSFIQMPDLSTEMKWAFVRGFFDGDGGVNLPTAFNYPVCNIASNSNVLLEQIRDFCEIQCSLDTKNHRLFWYGNNALDFMGKMYGNIAFGAGLSLRRKRERYEDWATWIPSVGWCKRTDPLFRCLKTEAGGVIPSKQRVSDSGYDLVLISKKKTFGNVVLYGTGIKIQPSYGYYFDMIPRSSIVKLGYMLANSVGIIDRSYIGEVMVPMVKIDASSPDIELPCRMVQIVPRQIVHVEFEIVAEFDDTARSSGGFGSTGTY
jgi:deoxyuridine 5'-triphosphate nucleotidohydrolase